MYNVTLCVPDWIGKGGEGKGRAVKHEGYRQMEGLRGELSPLG